MRHNRQSALSDVRWTAVRLPRMLCGMLWMVVIACSDTHSSRGPLLASAGNTVAEMSHVDLHPDDLIGTLVSASPLYGTLDGIAATTSALWVIDMAGDPFVHRIDVATGSVTSFGRRGEGPGELRGISSLHVANDSLFLFDETQGRLQIIADTATNWRSAVTVDLRTIAGRLPLDILPLRNATMLLQWADTAVPYGIATRGGDVLHRILLAPPGPESADLASRKEILFQSHSCRGATGDQIAIAYLKLGRLDIVSTADGDVRSADVPLDETPAVRTGSSGKTVLDRRRVYYRGCTGVGQNFAALFSGRHLDSFPLTEGALGRFVHVFGSNGQLRGVLRLDHAVSGIAIAPGDSLLYAPIRDRGEVWRYSLPAWVSR